MTGGELQLRNLVATDQVETLETVEEILIEVEVERLVEAPVGKAQAHLVEVLALSRQQQLIAVLFRVAARAAVLFKQNRGESLVDRVQLQVVNLVATGGVSPPVLSKADNHSAGWRDCRQVAVPHSIRHEREASGMPIGSMGAWR